MTFEFETEDGKKIFKINNVLGKDFIKISVNGYVILKLYGNKIIIKKKNLEKVNIKIND